MTDRESTKDLKECRKEIDRIDRQIIRLLEDRFDVVSEVAEYKRGRGLPVLDEAREREKLEALRQMCVEGKRDHIEQILKTVMAQSRRYQIEKMEEKEAPEKEPAYGLLGRGLSHSHSPQIHRMLGGYAYGLFSLEPDQLEAFFADRSWRGISVTMPYKRDAMEYCDEISPQARACGSVNTVVRGFDGQEQRPVFTCGHNTDYDGFKYVVDRSGIAVRGRKTLVLGSGGVSGTVVRVMRDLGADPVIIISRSGENNYENIDRHRDAEIIINATPAGMFPHAGVAALDVSAFPCLQAVYDLIYNPLRTKLMLEAEAAGIPAFGGLPMLIAQAAKAVDLFGYPLRMSIEEACLIIRQQLEHIVLIGMPGVGKTSVGRALAERTGRTFIDMDEAITAFEGRSPEEIIRSDGSDVFRDIETAMIRRVFREGLRLTGTGNTGPSDSSGLVVATGGGCVEREENRILLRENGKVFWLRRPLSDLPEEGRPLSQSLGPEEIFRRREGAYDSWSDRQISFRGITEAVEQILGAMEEDI